MRLLKYDHIKGLIKLASNYIKQLRLLFSFFVNITCLSFVSHLVCYKGKVKNFVTTDLK